MNIGTGLKQIAGATGETVPGRIMSPELMFIRFRFQRLTTADTPCPPELIIDIPIITGGQACTSMWGPYTSEWTIARPWADIPLLRQLPLRINQDINPGFDSCPPRSSGSGTLTL